MIIASKDGNKRVNMDNIFCFETRLNDDCEYEVLATSPNGYTTLLGVCQSEEDAIRVMINLDEVYESNYTIGADNEGCTILYMADLIE